MEWLDGRISETALSALRSMKPAKMELARDDHPLLALLQDDSRPPYVKDPHLFLMRLTSTTDGAPLAILVNWSDHPETLDSQNTPVTADYPHWLCQYVEDHGGGTAVFFNGSMGGLLSTLGDQVALLDPDTGKVAKDGTWKKAALFGSTIGELAMRALGSAEQAPVDSIVVRKSIIYSHLENDLFRVAGALGTFRDRKPLYTHGKLDPTVIERELPGLGKVKYAAGNDIETEVDYTQLRGGSRLLAEIATVPGEIYPELVNGGITRYVGADYPDAPFEPTLRSHLHVAISSFSVWRTTRLATSSRKRSGITRRPGSRFIKSAGTARSTHLGRRPQAALRGRWWG